MRAIGRALLAGAILGCFGATQANGQMSSTNCMAMGPNMVHCDTMDMSLPPSNYDGGAVLGRGIGNLIASIGEKSFRKKIGTMLAKGDCEGAARYALEKGRLDVGPAILNACRAQSPAARPISIAPNQLEPTLATLAANARVPNQIDEVTTITGVRAVGPTLVMSAVVKGEGHQLTDELKRGVVKDICQYPDAPALMRAGAAVQMIYSETSGREIGRVMVGKRECGF